MYLHLYFNPNKFADDGKALNRKLESLKEESLSGKRVSEYEKDYRGFFEKKGPRKEASRLPTDRIMSMQPVNDTAFLL